MGKVKREQIKQMFGGKCAYCGVELGDRWHVDHVKPVIRFSDIKKQQDGTYKFVSTKQMCHQEHDNDNNLFPACIACNIHKSSCDVEQFRRLLKGHVQMLNQSNSYSIYRHAKRFGLVQETEAEIVFWFQQYKTNNHGCGYGNAIVPQVAATFIGAYMKTVTFDEKLWKLVPIEPTEEMANAFVDEDSSITLKQTNLPQAIKRLYQAMIAAAPQPQREGE